MSEIVSEYVCPDCRQELKHEVENYTCTSCNAVWSIEHGIPRFARSEVLWSVFEPDVANKVTELAEQKGWQAAIDAYTDTIGKYTLGYIKNETRADWQVILPMGPESTVLDIGSGWGNIALGMSRWSKKIYCCDVNMNNLRLLNTRLRDENIKNVTTFQYDPNIFLSLPIPDDSVDVAVLNGVLEWMGNAEIDALPDQIQLEALKEIRRVLKPGGALYIGIENRYSVSTLKGLGLHGELPFVGLLPRPITNFLTKLIKGSEHRTYIYSLFGYKRLLARAGFSDVDYYWPYPSYHDPNYMIPLDANWVKRFWLENQHTSRSLKFRLARKLGLSRLPFHWLAFSYSMRCWK